MNRTDLTHKITFYSNQSSPALVIHTVADAESYRPNTFFKNNSYELHGEISCEVWNWCMETFGKARGGLEETFQPKNPIPISTVLLMREDEFALLKLRWAHLFG